MSAAGPTRKRSSSHASIKVEDIDAKWMKKALEEGKKGHPSPNPHVGSILVANGELVATGHHERAGEDHAEITAIKAAGIKASGATLYVTL
ncbi:MAG: deaminase [Polyangiaceae bacterium]